MIILEKPYVSEFLLETIVENDWEVLDNEIVQNADLNLLSTEEVVNYFLNQEFPQIYANSENAITWVL